MSKQFLSEQTKKTIQEVTLAYKTKRDQALTEMGFDEDSFKEKMTALRSKPFIDFERKLALAIENLQKSGFKVIEAADSNEARKEIKEQLEGFSRVIKSKSNTAREIGFERELFENNDQLKNLSIDETDLGDFLVQLFRTEDMHYVLPAIHLEPAKIAQKIKELFGVEVMPQADSLVAFLAGKIREKIMQAEVGITGANFFTQTGQIVLLENEGNISLVTRVPKKHIVIVGIDKLTETVEDAVSLSQAAAVFGTGQKITQYISIISGPSKTADIQNQLVVGAQGANEVTIILVDNGRRELAKTAYSDLLRCINCGACINFCPVYHNYGSAYGGKYIGSKGIVNEAIMGQSDLLSRLRKAQSAGSHDCTLCGNCRVNCPMKIDLPAMVRSIRVLQEQNGLQTDANRLMGKNMDQYGNPFGKVDDKETPDALYCC